MRSLPLTRPPDEPAGPFRVPNAGCSVSEPDQMPRFHRQAPFTPMAAIFLLSALMLAAPPAFARPPSVPADVSWCAQGRNLSFAQRISGCSAILTH
jgi:hypothetical protein